MYMGVMINYTAVQLFAHAVEGVQVGPTTDLDTYISSSASICIRPQHLPTRL